MHITRVQLLATYLHMDTEHKGVSGWGLLSYFLPFSTSNAHKHSHLLYFSITVNARWMRNSYLQQKKLKLMGWKDKITQVPLQQPPWEADSCYSGKEIPHLSRHPNVFTKTRPIQYKTSHAITLRRILILFLHQHLRLSWVQQFFMGL